MADSANFVRFLEYFALLLRRERIDCHRPQSGDQAGLYTDLMLVSYRGQRFFPKLALRLERRSVSRQELCEFQSFASRSPGPHDSRWLYLRNGSRAAFPEATRAAARAVVEQVARWVTPGAKRAQFTALAVDERSCSLFDLGQELYPPAPAHARLVAWLDAALIDGETDELMGRIVEVLSHGCTIEADGERYWAFRGCIRGPLVSEPVDWEDRRFPVLLHGTIVRFKPCRTATGLYASGVCRAAAPRPDLKLVANN